MTTQGANLRGRQTTLLDGVGTPPESAHRLGRSQQQQFGEAWTDSGYLCTKEDGTPYHPEVVSRYFRQAVKKAMLPMIRPHDLRHTHATLALRPASTPRSSPSGSATPTSRSPWTPTRTPSRPCRRRRRSCIAELVFAR